MWRHWRDKKGVENALTDYYADRLTSDPRLRSALTQRQSADLLIDKIMNDAADQEPDYDDDD
jgi:hypothetical protein